MDGSTDVGPIAYGCGGGNVLTEEEWAARIAPRPAEAIDWRGCNGIPIDPGYQVIPTIECEIAPDYDYATYPVRLCDAAPTCTRHDECTRQPNGRCTGVTDLVCQYPGVGYEACTSDEQCEALLRGFCSVPVNDELLCYPTGESAPTRGCAYPSEPCEQDSDCTTLSGGVCLKLVRFTQCEYYECSEDADCAPSFRCACHECVPSTCTSDADCAPAQICRLEVGCYGAGLAYHCSTSADECESSVDCGDLPCRFSDGRWQCQTSRCPTVP